MCAAVAVEAGVVAGEGLPGVALVVGVDVAVGVAVTLPVAVGDTRGERM